MSFSNDFRTKSLRERIKTLEADLKASPMRHFIYNDLPFAIFCYAPRDEWALRREIELLTTRLEHDTDRKVITLSLAELLWQAVDESEGIEAVVALERQSGFEAAQLQIQDYLSDEDWRPLPNLLEERLAALDPNSHLVFIMRAGALAPNLYRVSKLLDQMKGRTRVPCVLFMPATTEVPAWSGHGPHPTKVRLVEGEPGPQPVEVVAAGLTDADWQLLTVAEGAQGPRTYLFAAQRVWEGRDGLPGRECWLVLRRNPDGSEPKYYLSNAPADTPLLTLAQVGAKRWPIETEFQTEKGETGLDEYEVRSWPGWHHHITLSLLAGAFLLSLQQEWGKKYAPGDSAADQSRVARAVATASLDSRGLGAMAGRYSIAKRTLQAVSC